MSESELKSFDLKITIGLVEEDGLPKLSIKESFNMPREELLVKLPNVFLRTDRLYDRISDLKVSGMGKLKYHRSDPSVLLLENPAGDRVEISYLFGPYDQRSNSKQESFSAPIIRDQYFQFVGLMALAYPYSLVNAKPFPLTLTWDLPQGFQTINSFGFDERKQAVTTDFDKLRDGLFVAGKDMRFYKLNVHDRPVYISIEGNFSKISDKDFIDTINKLILTQRETWQDFDFPYFFINIISNPQPCSGNIKFAGTAHTNSFRAFFPSDCAFLPEMKQLISHELMHMWIGKKIKVGQERGNIDGKWFTEGWTDYFGRLLAYNADILTESQYFDSLNRQLEKYSASAENQKTLNEQVQRMYRRNISNRDLEDVPYQQGEIMALSLNKQIKMASNHNYSLTDVVREMLKEAKLAGGVKNFSINEIARIVDKFDANAKNSFLPEYAKIEGGDILYPPNLEQCRMAQSQKFSRYVPRRTYSRPIISYGPSFGSCHMWLNEKRSVEQKPTDLVRL